MNSILMVIAPNGFREEELFDTRKEILNAGINVVLCSTKRGECIGSKGVGVVAEVDLHLVKSSDYEAVVFIGGRGSKIFFNDGYAHKIAHEMLQEGKVVSAICIATVILGEAGLLKNKKVTVHESEIETIRKLGGLYTGEYVSQDGLIITCNGPTSASLFGKILVEEVKRHATLTY